jgi:hypothetical protein
VLPISTTILDHERAIALRGLDCAKHFCAVRQFSLVRANGDERGLASFSGSIKDSRRGPLIFGDVTIDLVGYDPTAAALPANVTQINQNARG